MSDMPKQIRAWWNMGKPTWAKDSSYLTGVQYVRADLALPRPWSTAEELDALPCGSIVLDRDKDAHEKCSGGVWYTLTWRGPTKSGELAGHGPGRIIYVPEAPDAQ